MYNCAYYKINFTGLLKILIKLHKISAKYYVVTYAYAHAPSREDTRIVKGEKGEYRGGEGRGRRV